MVLPEPGGIYDQPALVMEAFTIIKTEYTKFHDHERRQKDKAREQQAGSPPGRNTTVRH